MKKSFYTLVWVGLLSVASLACFWFTGRFGANLYQFFRLSTQIQGKILEWRVIEPFEGQFHLCAKYSYRVDGINYLGEQIFRAPVFNNPHSAEHVLKRYVNRKWPVWVVKKHPNISTLQREFSIKLLVQALMSIGVLIYFFWLKEYMAIHSATDSATSKMDRDSNENPALHDGGV